MNDDVNEFLKLYVKSRLIGNIDNVKKQNINISYDDLIDLIISILNELIDNL